MVRHSHLAALPRPLITSISRPFHHLRTVFFLLLSIPFLPMTLADCECGYLATVNNIPSASSASNHHLNNRNVNHHHRHRDADDNHANKPRDGNTPETALFTDLLETDFARLTTADLTWSETADWARQAFNLTAERARGEYGEMFAVENVRIAEHGEGVDKEYRDKVLELVVRSQVVDGMVSVAELDTTRMDFMWGSFRAMMKVSGVGGMCAAFFWVSSFLLFLSVAFSWIHEAEYSM